MILCQSHHNGAVWRSAHRGSVDIGDLALESGQVLPHAQMAWQASSAPGLDRPVVLLLHGYSNSHVFWQPDPPADLTSGWGNQLVGPGAAVDSERHLIIALNHLGSCYGSTGPNTIDPATGNAYGERFPRITITDQARAATAALRALHFDHLSAIVGYSYGGYIALDLALAGMMPHEKVAILASGPKGNGSDRDLEALWRLAAEASPETLEQRRLDTLKTYGLSPDDPAVRAAASEWARRHDVISLLRLREAAISFDRRRDLPSLRAPLFWLHVGDDALFPPPPDNTMDTMAPAGLRRYDLPSGGHLAPIMNPESFQEPLAAFLDNAEPQAG